MSSDPVAICHGFAAGREAAARDDHVAAVVQFERLREEGEVNQARGLSAKRDAQQRRRPCHDPGNLKPVRSNS